MRTTDDKKDRRVIIRVNEETYRYLTSREENISEYLRDLIQRDMVRDELTRFPELGRDIKLP